MTVEAMINEVPDTLPSSAKSEINELADDLKDNPAKAKELILNNKDLVNKIQESLNDASDFTQEDIQDYFTVVSFISKYSELTAKEKQNITAVKNKILAIDYANVYDTKRADISSILLKDNIVGDVQSGGTKHVQNPSQFYPDYLKTYANNDTEQMIFLSLEEKQKAVLDIYKQDMLDAIQVFLNKLNKSGEYNKSGQEYNINAITLMLSKESTGENIYKLSQFLLDSQQPLETFNDLTSDAVKIKYDESVEQFMKTILKLEQAYHDIVREESSAYVMESETFKYVPGSFEFYTEDDILQQLVDFAGTSAPSKYITFDVSGSVYAKNFLYTPTGTRKQYPTLGDSKLLQAENTTDKTVVFLGSYEKEAKGTISKADYNVNLEEYKNWLAFNEKQNTVQSMKEYIEMPKTPLNVLHDEIEHVGVDNIKEVQLGKDMYEKYAAQLQKLYPTLTLVQTDNVNQLLLKENTTYTESKIVGEQYFFAGDTKTDNEKTQQLIGDNLSNILQQLQSLKDSKNVKIMIEGSASYLPPPKGTTNPQLATDRAENAKQLLIAASGDAISPDQIITTSSVNGPAYEGTHTPEEIATMEKNIYRDHQYVKISIVHDVEVSKESSKKIIEFPKKQSVPDLFGFAMQLPPANRTDIKTAGDNDANNPNLQKALKDVDKESYQTRAKLNS